MYLGRSQNMICVGVFDRAFRFWCRYTEQLAEIGEEQVRVGSFSRPAEFPFGDEGLDGGCFCRCGHDQG